MAVTAEDSPSFLPLPSFLASKNLLYQILLFTDKASFFLASLVPWFLPSFLPSLLSGFISLDANVFLMPSEFFWAPLPLDIGSSKKSICCAMIFLVFCHHCHSSHRDDSLSPRGVVIGRSLPGIET